MEATHWLTSVLTYSAPTVVVSGGGRENLLSASALSPGGFTPPTLAPFQLCCRGTASEVCTPVAPAGRVIITFQRIFCHLEI